MRRQYRFKLSHRQSKLYLKIYKLLKRVGGRSDSMESMLEHGGLYYTVHDRKMDGYQFRDIEIVVAHLYEVTEANELGRQLKRIANRNGGAPFDFRFDGLKNALSGDFETYSANVGSLLLDKEKNSEWFKRISFKVQVINGTYFMLYSSFYLSDSANEKLNDARLKDSVKGAIGFSVIPQLKKYMLDYSFHHKYENLYQFAFNDVSNGANSILQKYLSKPLVSVQAVATLYKTPNGLKKIRDDFRKNSIGDSPIYNKGEMLFVENSVPQVRFFIKTKNMNASPGYNDYPNHLTEDIGAVLMYEAFGSYVVTLQKETNKVIHRLAGHFLAKRNFSLRQLKKYNNGLIIWRYHLRSISSMLDGPAWNRYIRWEKWEGTALKRLDKTWTDKNFSFSKIATENISANIQACEQSISNALSRVESELSAKNTASNNHLSWVVVCVTVVALIVASVAMFTALYPESTRNWLCQERKLFCSMK